MFKMIYNIARTELQMLFYSPVAWLILVVFGVQSGMLFADKLTGLLSSQEMGYNIEGSTITIFASTSSTAGIISLSATQRNLAQ
jgi:ABC-2 type transport system permease protein